MIPQPEVTAVFHYASRPLAPEFKMTPQDAGFSLTLLYDDRLVTTLYNEPILPRCRMEYAMPPELKMQCLKLIDEANGWLGGLPARLCLPESEHRAPRYASQFGFQGYPYITCSDIGLMARSAFGTPEGRAARHLCALYEDLAQLFLPCGVQLDVDGYGIAPNVLPIREEQIVPNWENAEKFG